MISAVDLTRTFFILEGPRMDLAPNEYRCRSCHKLLFRGVLVEGEVEIMCKSCKEVTTVKKSQFNTLLCMIEHCPHRIHCPSAKN